MSGELSVPLVNLNAVVDLNMPAGLTDDQRRQWLREVGAALVRETGQPSGQIEHRDNDGQPSWLMWWTEADHHPHHHNPARGDPAG